MSEVKQHVVIYDEQNQEPAEQLSIAISKAGYPVQMHARHKDSYDFPMGDIEETADSHVVLLITDNSLKSAGCMNGVLAAARKWSDEDQLTTVVAPGTEFDESGNISEVETHFDRVNSIIQYMNYWQDKYLELRKEKRNSDKDQELKTKIAVTKEISADAGEFLRFLRETGYYEWEDYLKLLAKKTGEEDEDASKQHVAEGDATDEHTDSNAGEDFPSPDEKSLVEMIENSSEELIAENSELEKSGEEGDKSVDSSHEEDEELLDSIPGMNLLKEREESSGSAPKKKKESSIYDEITAEDAEQGASHYAASGKNSGPESRANREDNFQDLDEENEELMSILDEVLQDEDTGLDPDDEEYRFLGDDPENPDDFDLDSLFDEDDNIAEEEAGKQADEEEEAEEADLLEDEAELLLDFIDEDEVYVKKSGKKIQLDIAISEAVQLFSNGENDEAVAYLEALVEENPDNTTLRYYFAVSLARFISRYEDAGSQLEILLSQDEEHPDAWFLLGELAENQQEYKMARSCFENVVNLEPEYPEVHYRLGLLIDEYFENEVPLVISFLQEAIQQDKSNTDARYMLANVLYEKDDQPDEAIRNLKEVLKSDPGHPFANYDLALIHYGLGKKEDAAAYYSRAVSINPDLRTEENEAVFKDSESGDLAATAPETSSEEEKALPSPEEKEEVTAGKHLPVEKERAEQEGADVESSPEKENDTNKEQQSEALLKRERETSPIVLITGATAGIGRATAELFAQNGYRLILTGRRTERLEELSEDFTTRFNTSVQALTFDVRDPEKLRQSMDALPEAWKNVDILINNAGLSRGLAPIHEGKIEDWDTMIDTNIKGLLYMTRAIAPQMVKRRKGHIINVASSAGKEVYPGGNVYCATKSAVEALTHAMRLDLYTHNIRVSQVAPGHVEETEFARVRFDWDVEKASKVYENFQPLRSSDVAEAIYFIATRPPHVNIQDIFMFGTQQAGSNFIDRSGR